MQSDLPNASEKLQPSPLFFQNPHEPIAVEGGVMAGVGPVAAGNAGKEGAWSVRRQNFARPVHDA